MSRLLNFSRDIKRLPNTHLTDRQTNTEIEGKNIRTNKNDTREFARYMFAVLTSSICTTLSAQGGRGEGGGQNK